MTTNRLVIDGREYLLAPRENVRALIRRAVRATRQGGGSIAFRALGVGRVSVLVTRKTALRIESARSAKARDDSGDHGDTGEAGAASELLDFLEHHL